MDCKLLIIITFIVNVVSCPQYHAVIFHQYCTSLTTNILSSLFPSVLKLFCSSPITLCLSFYFNLYLTKHFWYSISQSYGPIIPKLPLTLVSSPMSCVANYVTRLIRVTHACMYWAFQNWWMDGFFWLIMNCNIKHLKQGVKQQLAG